MARLITLIYNWWSLFVRLADPDHHREAITSWPLLLHGIARGTQHAGQTRLTVTSSHGRRRLVVAALRRITGFFRSLIRSAEQLNAEDRSPGFRRLDPRSQAEFDPENRPPAASNCRIWGYQPENLWRSTNSRDPNGYHSARLPN